MGIGDKDLLGIESSVDSWMIQCLDAVNDLLNMRQSVTQILREGWMEIARARYAMGPSRISYPLLSLRPRTASTCVALSGVFDDEDSHFRDDPESSDAGEPVNVSFTLLKGTGHDAQSSRDMSPPSVSASASQLRRRVPYRASGDGSLDKALEDLILSDDSGSDNETTLASSKGNDQQQDPLHMFGALVSPDVRSAQGSFLKALDLVVRMANTQASVVHAHGKVMELKDMLAHSDQPDAEALLG